MPELAGGVLLDLTIYPLTIADIALGQPLGAPKGLCAKNENGLDVQEAVQLEYEGGRLASFFVSGRAVLDNTATGGANRAAWPWRPISGTPRR